MNPLQIPPLSDERIAELDDLYRKTRDVRLRTRVQIVLLAGEKQMHAAEIASIVRKDEDTVRFWLKRYVAEGIKGLYDRRRTGAPSKVTPAYKEKLLAVVRLQPGSLDRPYSVWTLQRLADYMAEETGIRVDAETVREHLKAAGIVLSRWQHKDRRPDSESERQKRRLKKSATG